MYLPTVKIKIKYKCSLILEYLLILQQSKCVEN